MTHYDVDYSLLNGQAKIDKALNDIGEFLGNEKYVKLSLLFRTECPSPPSLDQFQLMLSFVGVRGYPTVAWYETLWPKKDR